MKGFEGDDVSAFTAIHRTVSSYSRDRRKKIQYLYQFLLGSCSKKTFLMTSVQAEEKIRRQARRNCKSCAEAVLQDFCHFGFIGF